jgi:hypothetical protein
VLVSADPRYGPVYNLGVAREVARSLGRQGYPVHQGVPVYLLAYSGGAQIAVGIAPYLRDNLGARVVVLGLGAVLTDDPSITAVHRLVNLQGSADWVVPRLGQIFYPGRWLPYSAFNRFVRQGRLEVKECGPIWHVGRRDYFSRSAQLDDGTSFADHCADLVAAEMKKDPA